MESSLQSRLSVVESRLAAALARAQRSRSDITLVAVSKKFSAAVVREGYAAGLRDFGENYVQEFALKHPQLSDLAGARFHLIGHLQSNKARQAVELFDAVQTVDSPKLLERLNRAAEERGRVLEIMFEIKLSPEENKYGAGAADLPDLLDAASRCTSLRVTGLMTMPPWSENQEDSRPYFRELAKLARAHGLQGLSMGMSNDFEAAVEEGATVIRVGTGIFGPRPKPVGSEA